MKLKAWDNHEKRWAKTHEIEGELFINPEAGDTGVFYIHDHSASGKLHYTVVKSTGLKDRHRKEVWEGAKLKSGEGGIGIVSWGDGFWKIDFQTFSTGLSSEYARRLEVIGNIFEGEGGE